jgi:3-phenylpropionate/cinnamic acid dioxygenase small subunit
MSRWTIVVAVSFSIGVAGAGWGYAQQKKAAGMLTPQDYNEIQQLYANYSQALDKGQGERFAALFTADGEFTSGRPPGRGNETRTPLKGTERLTRMGSVGGGRHFTANLVITQTPEGANGSCYLLLFNVRNIPATITETAIYQDTLVKTTQGWRFNKRVVWRDDDDISPFKPKPQP